MCNLCGTEQEKKIGRESERQRASDLRRMAGYCDMLANGKLKPHNNEDMGKVTVLAKSLIRSLMQDYF